MRASSHSTASARLNQAMRRLFLLALAAATFAAPSRAAEPLVDIPFAVGIDDLIDEERNDGFSGFGGRWELLEGRLAKDALRLTFRIRAPSHELPVEPGPAVLFGGLRLWGDAGGDMGAGETVDSFAAVTLDPCLGMDCLLVATIDLPINDLRPAIKRLEKGARLTEVSAELTLIRTFGGGTWLQVLPFRHRGDGAIAALTGRLGAIEPTVGPLFPYGLFPAEQATRVRRDPRLFPRGFGYAAAVEKHRQQAGDETKPLATAPGTLTVRMVPMCEGSPALTLHDEGGDRIFDAKLHRVPDIKQRVAVPVDVPWWLTLHDGGGIDSLRFGFGVRIGPVATKGAPIAIDADFDCSVPSAVVRVNGAIVGATEPSPTSAAASSIAVASPPGTSPSATALASRPTSSAGSPPVPLAIMVIAAVMLGSALIALGFVTRPPRT